MIVKIYFHTEIHLISVQIFEILDLKAWKFKQADLLDPVHLKASKLCHLKTSLIVKTKNFVSNRQKNAL